MSERLNRPNPLFSPPQHPSRRRTAPAVRQAAARQQSAADADGGSVRTRVHARSATSSAATAQALLQLVMVVMQSVAAELRASQRFLEPTQMGSLMRIAAGPCTMTDLARHKAVSLPTISKSVNMLVRRGWVERWIDTKDRRQTLVRLTPSGRRALADIQERAEQHVAERLAPLSADERRQLMSLIGRLTTVLG